MTFETIDQVLMERRLLRAELAAAKANAEADQEVYHQVYMVLLNAGANKYLGAYEQAKALVARLTKAERLIQEVATISSDADVSNCIDEARRLVGVDFLRATDSAPAVQTVPRAPLEFVCGICSGTGMIDRGSTTCPACNDSAELATGENN